MHDGKMDSPWTDRWPMPDHGISSSSFRPEEQRDCIQSLLLQLTDPTKDFTIRPKNSYVSDYMAIHNRVGRSRCIFLLTFLFSDYMDLQNKVGRSGWFFFGLILISDYIDVDTILQHTFSFAIHSVYVTSYVSNYWQQ